MRIDSRLAVLAALCLMSTLAHADGEGFGRCKDGFAEDTLVRTESRGDMTIREVQVSDRVWSFNEMVGKPGWSRVVQRIEGQEHYKLLSDFTEPDSGTVTKACWRIRRTG